MEIKNNRILIIASTLLLLYVFVSYCFNNVLNLGLNKLIPSFNFNSISLVGKLFDMAGSINNKSTEASDNSIYSNLNSADNIRDKSDSNISARNNVTELNSKFNEIAAQVSAASSKADSVKNDLDKISNQTQESFTAVGSALGKMEAKLDKIEKNIVHNPELNEHNNSIPKNIKVDNIDVAKSVSVISKASESTQVNTTQVFSKSDSITDNNLNVKISDLNRDLIKNFETTKKTKDFLAKNLVDDNIIKELINNQLPQTVLKKTQESEISSRQFIDDKQWIADMNARVRIENALSAFNKDSSIKLSVLIYDSLNEMNVRTADINLNNRIYLVIVHQGGLRIKFITEPQYSAVLTKKISNEIITKDMFPVIRKGERAAGIINAINQIEKLFKNTNNKDLNYQPSKIDNIPVAIKQVHPEYPKELINSKIKGEVVVDFIVDRNGKVDNAYIVRSTNVAFNQSAIDAILQWKFRPGTKNGINVDMHLQVPLLFNPSNLE
jgi:TonB family protein